MLKIDITRSDLSTCNNILLAYTTSAIAEPCTFDIIPSR